MRLIRVIIFGLIAACNFAKFILIGSYFNMGVGMFCIAVAVVEVIIGKWKKEIKHKVLYFLGTVFAALIMVWISTWEFGFANFGVYALKIRYADRIGYTTSHFPQEVPENARLLNCTMMPTIMQGSGNVQATFGAEGEVLEALEQQAKEACIMSFSAADYVNGNLPEEDQKLAQKIFEEKTDFENTEARIQVCDPTGMIRECASTHDMTIYILDSNFYWNHIHTDSVLVDHTGHEIQYVGE
ncbi:MAG: hypothetical protein K6E18_07025 [Lachnospiraceae bacterium]|nr:hypothetical protein [Lachnospiraceae bacterium]